MAKTKKPKKLSEADCQKKIEAYLRAKDRGKKAYGQADVLLNELLAGGFEVGTDIRLGGNRVARLVDNFATKNKVFKTAGVARFDLAIDHDQP